MLSIQLYRRFSFYLSFLVCIALPFSFYVSAAQADEQMPQKVSEEVDTAQPKINVNSADADEIAKNLKGVGMKKAEAIVQYRKVNGSFTSVADLLKVKGIGQSILKRNKDAISI